MKISKEQFEEIERLKKDSDFNSVMNRMLSCDSCSLLSGLDLIDVATAWISPEKIIVS